MEGKFKVAPRWKKQQQENIDNIKAFTKYVETEHPELPVGDFDLLEVQAAMREGMTPEQIVKDFRKEFDEPKESKKEVAIGIISKLKVGERMKIGHCEVLRCAYGRWDVSTSPTHGASSHRSIPAVYREVAFRNKAHGESK
jgi:hypothetical protein